MHKQHLINNTDQDLKGKKEKEEKKTKKNMVNTHNKPTTTTE